MKYVALFFQLIAFASFNYAGTMIISNGSSQTIVKFDSTRTSKEVLDSLLRIKIIDSATYKLIFANKDSLDRHLQTVFKNKTGIIRGGRTKTDIMDTVMLKLTDIRRIYNKRLVKNKELNGGVLIGFYILPKGYLMDCKIIESTTNDADFDVQILDNVRKWRFSNSKDKKDTTIVNYPFIFRQ